MRPAPAEGLISEQFISGLGWLLIMVTWANHGGQTTRE
jgi:hypothetical protein